VDAEAVVIEDPQTAPDVTGKIIVARMTDPGWVFLMIASAGLIVEKGSLLSHTAIIGRELGIPTIVGVPHAASRIRCGQRIRMDGSKGEVVLAPVGAVATTAVAG
jgi:pyruvate,water dikinase